MYIDPSIGAQIFQVLAVLFGFLSGGVLLFSSRIKMELAKFRRRRRERNEGNAATLENQSESGAAEK